MPKFLQFHAKIGTKNKIQTTTFFFFYLRVTPFCVTSAVFLDVTLIESVGEISNIVIEKKVNEHFTIAIWFFPLSPTSIKLKWILITAQLTIETLAWRRALFSSCNCLQRSLQVSSSIFKTLFSCFRRAMRFFSL